MMASGPIKGRCQAMCSARECRERQQRGAIHSLEATPDTARLPPSQRKVDPTRAVKQHVRTAEGRAEAADQVRSLDWLRITVTYLLGELQLRALSEGYALHAIFAFVSDRLMAVRKDLVMQDLRGAVAIGLYEEIIRYLILMGYLLNDKAPPDFDAHLNMGAVRSGLSTLHSLYHEAASSSESPPDCLQHRDEFLSYQVLVHVLDLVRHGPVLGPDLGLDSVLTLLPRGVSIRGSLPLTYRSLSVVSALARGNHIRVMRAFAAAPTTSPPTDTASAPPGSSPFGGSMSLHRCLVHALLPVVRRRALDVFNRSLFFKDWTTMAEVARLLGFRDESQATAFCALYHVPMQAKEQKPQEGGADADNGSPPIMAANFHKKVVLSDPDVRDRERLQEVTRVLACRHDADVLGSEFSADMADDWTAVHERLVRRAGNVPPTVT